MTSYIISSVSGVEFAREAHFESALAWAAYLAKDGQIGMVVSRLWVAPNGDDAACTRVCEVRP